MVSVTDAHGLTRANFHYLGAARFRGEATDLHFLRKADDLLETPAGTVATPRLPYCLARIEWGFEGGKLSTTFKAVRYAERLEDFNEPYELTHV